jgi:hypothetical protein
MKQRLLILAATLFAAASLAPLALAGSPTKTQYPQAAVLVAKTKKPRPASQPTTTVPTAAPTSGTLPFTGADLGIVAALGTVLLVGGVTLSVVGRRRTGE